MHFVAVCSHHEIVKSDIEEGNNLHEIDKVDFSVCVEWCWANTSCLAYTYLWNNCYFKDINDLSSKVVKSTWGSSLYVYHCTDLQQYL